VKLAVHEGRGGLLLPLHGYKSVSVKCVTIANSEIIQTQYNVPITIKLQTWCLGVLVMAAL